MPVLSHVYDETKERCVAMSSLQKNVGVIVKTIVPTEHAEQVAFIHWADAYFNNRDCFVFAIPNGGLRNKMVAIKMKAEGVRAGVPDLFLPLPKGKYHGLFIEMKRLKGGGLTDPQKEKIPLLESCGFKVAVCRGWEAAREAVLEYDKDTPPVCDED